MSIGNAITRIAAVAALLLAVVLAPGPAGAVEPDEVLPDPALEARAREVSKELRCLVCQNQSIDDSDAELARDLRVLVRERVAAGDSNEEVMTYVVSRYGDFVLLRPPFKSSTYLLWLGPALILVVGLVAIGLFYRRRRLAGADDGAPGLSESERARLARLMDEEPQ
jgi:cytochrome c-type biogenesis protein CcmH